jgi:hemerythrin-like domain-containing protein
MPTAKTTRQSAAGKTARTRQPDAIVLLKEDHAKVNALFEQYKKSRSAAKKQSIVATICRELTVHAMVEEEIFYPAVKAALKDKELVPEAVVEHATLKEFIAKLDGRQPDGEMYDAQVQVLGEYVKHHVKEEQTEMFPKARKTRLDMAQLGQQILDRKEALMADPEGLPKAPEAVADLPAEATA